MRQVTRSLLLSAPTDNTFLLSHSLFCAFPRHLSLLSFLLFLCKTFLHTSMSGLYAHSFSPARALSPQIRRTADVDRYNKIYRVIEFFLMFLLLNFQSFLMISGVYESWVVLFVGGIVSTWQSCWQSIKSLVLSCRFFLYVAVC